jgi:long-chain acyl-CoA synthetase
MADRGFWVMAQKDPSALGLVTPEGAEQTRGELLAACNQLVHGLRERGLEKGDCVATFLPNGAPMIELYLAVAQAGLYLVPINWHLTGPEAAYILQDCEAKVFVSDARFTEAASKAACEAGLEPGQCFAVGDIEGFSRYEDLKAGQPSTTPEDRASGTVMNYTSGTTGRPKGVRRKLPPIDPDTSATLTSVFLMMFGVTAEGGNVHLCGSPLYHTAVMMFAGCALHLGHAVVLMDKWTPEDMLALIEKYRVTNSHMVPTQFNRLLALPDEVRKRYDVSSLRWMVHAAAPCPIDTKWKMFEWWGDCIYEYYAASEGGGTIVTPEQWKKYPGTVGTPFPNSEIRILDDDGNDVPTGEVGIVWMKMGGAEFEYHKAPEKTAENRRGEYFTVGDMGYLNEEGYLFLSDRKNDMIISGGVNIYPAEIEKDLQACPGVADVAVFGIPHEDWGEEVKAVVQPEEGVVPDDALRQRIWAFCKERVAKYKTPRSIDFIEEMPRDPNGKLYKRKLRDPYWEGKARQI